MFHRNLTDDVAHSNRDLSREYRLPIFRYPYLVNFEVALRLRAQSVASHATTLHKFILRLKARGFHHPDGALTRSKTAPSKRDVSLPHLWQLGTLKV